MASSSAQLPPETRPPLLVLGAEQEWLARSLETVLGPQGFAVVRGHSGEQTLQLAASINPDAILIDSRLSDIDGVDVCRRLREGGSRRPHVPIVLVTSGPVPREFVRDAYEAGAWGVWEQPLDGELLAIRLRTWMEVKRLVDIAERDRHIDARTSLYTYSGLQLRARELVADASRRATPVACIAVRALALPHPPGASDERRMPQAAGEAVRRTMSLMARSSDIIGQSSDAGFVILAPMTGPAGAATIVSRLRDRIAALPTYLQDGEALGIIIRAGVATFESKHVGFGDGSDLLLRASTALRFAHASASVHAPTFDEVPSAFH
jgi:PleD family two-component response regulator